MTPSISASFWRGQLAARGWRAFGHLFMNALISYGLSHYSRHNDDFAWWASRRLFPRS